MIAFSAKDSGADAGELAPTLRAGGHAKSHANARVMPAVAIPFDTTQVTSAANYSQPKAGDPCHPLAAHAHAPAVAFDTRNGTEDDVSMTLQAAGIGSERGGNPNAIPHTMSGAQVRRLTPRECERLQGFPDDYTLIPYRNKPAADGPRYRALGNSMAVPVMRWIGLRIQLVEQLVAELEEVA